MLVESITHSSSQSTCHVGAFFCLYQNFNPLDENLFLGPILNNLLTNRPLDVRIWLNVSQIVLDMGLKNILCMVNNIWRLFGKSVV